MLNNENEPNVFLQLTWADVMFTTGHETMNFIAKKDLLANYPNLQAVRDNVLAIPAIKEWVAKRPKTDF